MWICVDKDGRIQKKDKAQDIIDDLSKKAEMLDRTNDRNLWRERALRDIEALVRATGTLNDLDNWWHLPWDKRTEQNIEKTVFDAIEFLESINRRHINHAV